MERFFNIAGPCIAAKNYMLPALSRLPQVVSLMRKEQYFVVHVPRRGGKTTVFAAPTKQYGGEMLKALIREGEDAGCYRNEKGTKRLAFTLWACASLANFTR